MPSESPRGKAGIFKAPITGLEVYSVWAENEHHSQVGSKLHDLLKQTQGMFQLKHWAGEGVRVKRDLLPEMTPEESLESVYVSELFFFPLPSSSHLCFLMTRPGMRPRGQKRVHEPGLSGSCPCGDRAGLGVSCWPSLREVRAELGFNGGEEDVRLERGSRKGKNTWAPGPSSPACPTLCCMPNEGGPVPQAHQTLPCPVPSHILFRLQERPSLCW